MISHLIIALKNLENFIFTTAPLRGGGWQLKYWLRAWYGYPVVICPAPLAWGDGHPKPKLLDPPVAPPGGATALRGRPGCPGSLPHLQAIATAEVVMAFLEQLNRAGA